jgi:uncharacterized protein (DUF58 family)
MQTADLLRKVRRLEIRSRHLVEDLFSGQTESIFKGRGVEFEEVRPYVVGDEVRDIDWNVTARLGAPYVKRFVEERELTVLLVVDVSRSMRFGTAGVEKRELAAELCAVLGFAALRNNDRVGWCSRASASSTSCRPRAGAPICCGCCATCWARAAARRHRTREAARFVLRTTRRRSLIFWISDFEDPLDVARLARAGRPPRPDRVVLRDPRDEVLPAVGWVELEDLESGTRTLVDTSSAACAGATSAKRAAAACARAGARRSALPRGSSCAPSAPTCRC